MCVGELWRSIDTTDRSYCGLFDFSLSRRIDMSIFLTLHWSITLSGYKEGSTTQTKEAKQSSSDTKQQVLVQCYGNRSSWYDHKYLCASRGWINKGIRTGMVEDVSLSKGTVSPTFSKTSVTKVTAWWNHREPVIPANIDAVPVPGTLASPPCHLCLTSKTSPKPLYSTSVPSPDSAHH